MKAVILAGGTGSRLWPMSRDLKPKQFHTFVGKSTMLQQTYKRISFLNQKDIFVSTNAQYESLVKKQLPFLKKENLIIEPAMRDTGPGICFAAHCLANLGFENEVMSIIYADTLIQKAEEFKKALQFTGSYVKRTDCLSVIAVRAKYPNPNLGYIHLGPLLGTADNGLEIYELDKFVEKPDMATAKRFLYSYKYLWNTGLYVWRIKTILDKFKKLSPKIYKAAKNKKTFEAAPKISVDYAIMEKISANSVRVIPADLGWNDIGNWSALHEEIAENDSENVSSGEHISIETSGSVVFGNKNKLIVTAGVKDMIIVDTKEVLLVMHKEKAGKVKKVVEELRKKKKEKYL